jgi:TRAP transporter 4TM/12TM fusion protein
VDIALAAAIPSILFYFGLFVQIDAYSARRGLKGLERHELPLLIAALKEGWVYLFVFALLIFMMVALRQETLAPFWATGLLLIINQCMRSHRFTLTSFGNMISGVGRSLSELTAVLLGVGLIVGSFSATGLAGTLVNELIFLAGNSVIMLLFMGALTAFVFGMGMTVTACYIFLAVVLAPALEQAGLNRLAVHLFILYWGTVSYITPPVALGAFAASAIAGSSALRTGYEAMRLGGVKYLAPFLFVLNPALIGEAPALEVLGSFIAACFGIWLIASAMQGYVSFFGGFPAGLAGIALRLLLAAGGLLVALPGGELTGYSHWTLAAAGIALAVLPLTCAWQRGRATA